MNLSHSSLIEQTQMPSLNPREVLNEKGEEYLRSLLRSVGYHLQPKLVRDLCHVLRSQLPWLISGPRGAGKTALAEALAEACGIPLFYLQGMEGITREEVLGKWNKQAQDLHVEYEVRYGGRPLAEVKTEIYQPQFYEFAQPLAAYVYAQENHIPPVLILDEVDKLEPKVQDMFLQLLGRGYAYIQGLGTVGVQDRKNLPIVILCSNDIRHELSPPFRSRCLYSFLSMPTIVEQAEILALRCPQASIDLVRQVAKVLDAMQGMRVFTDKPGPREAIEFLKAMYGTGIEYLNRQVLDGHAGFLVKTEIAFLNYIMATDYLAEAATTSHSELDCWRS